MYVVVAKKRQVQVAKDQVPNKCRRYSSSNQIKLELINKS